MPTSITELISTFYEAASGKPELLAAVLTDDWDDIPLPPGQQPGRAGAGTLIERSESADRMPIAGQPWASSRPAASPATSRAWPTCTRKPPEHTKETRKDGNNEHDERHCHEAAAVPRRRAVLV
jgi:hypothetical protein